MPPIPMKWSSPPKWFMPSTSASIVSTPATGAATTTWEPKIGSRKNESSTGVWGISVNWLREDELESRTGVAVGVAVCMAWEASFAGWARPHTRTGLCALTPAGTRRPLVEARKVDETELGRLVLLLSILLRLELQLPLAFSFALTSSSRIAGVVPQAGRLRWTAVVAARTQLCWTGDYRPRHVLEGMERRG